jgi:hypothetical protein
MIELHIDTVGSFSKDIRGALHIPVIIDNFIRYVTPLISALPSHFKING